MKRSRYKNSVVVINKRSRFSHNIGVMMQMLVLIITWYQDKVCKSRVEIMWVDHINKSCE